MGQLRYNGDDGDQSYILVPLQNLMRGRRNSGDGHPKEDDDPLYVMFPFQEMIRKARELDGNLDTNIPSQNTSEVLSPDKSEPRKRREISKRASCLLKKKKIAKRRPHVLSVRRERMSPNELINDADYDDNLRSDLYEKPNRPKANHVSVEQYDKKSKNSLYPTDLKSHLIQEAFGGVHQKPRILSDIGGLTPEFLQAVIAKPKKASVNPINITMFISNLIPPNEVENTKITNAGKLYKSGCLKFSIQLERPGSCSCPPDDNGFEDGKSTCGQFVTQKMACMHSGAADDKGKPAADASSGSTGNSPHSCGLVPSSKGQGGSADSAADANRSSDLSSSKDVSSLLLQLIGADKKLMKKPVVGSGQTILMDGDVLKELQRLLSYQVASKGSEAAGKSVSTAPAPSAAPIGPNSQKARAIAEALNLFSKYAGLKQKSS